MPFMRRTVAFLFFWVVFAGIIFGLFGATIWYWDTRHIPIEVTLSTETLMAPREPIMIRFSRSVRPASFATNFTLTPAHPVRTEWHDNQTLLLIVPESDWPLMSHFQVSLGPGQTTWFGPTPRFTWRVPGPEYPKIVATSPPSGARDVLLGIEDPIRVTFDRSVSHFFIDFRLEPAVEVIYENNSEKTEFALLPKTALPEGTEQRLSFWAKWRGAPDEAYHLLGTTRFTTLPPASKSVSRDLTVRVDEAKQLTRAKKTEGKYIDINLTSQVMTLFEQGQAVEAYVISSGKRGMDTPVGEFAVENKALRPWSKQYGLYMPYWQAITADGKYGIHELPEWPGGYKEGANHLGTPVSHGCVRLGVGAAARVFAWSDIGTPIIIY